MPEHVADFEWRGEGEDAEVVLYAPDSTVAAAAFEQALPATRLPGVISPIYAAASSHVQGLPDASRGFGLVAASETHAAADLVSAPEWGLLLVADALVEDVGTPEEAPRLIGRGLSEVALPSIGGAEVRKAAESGALWAAEEGLIEEEDLPLFAVEAGDADALGRRALAAGTRDWTRPGSVRPFRVTEILDSEGAEALGLEPGVLALVVSVGAEDLGRLALAAHRERILARVSSEVFGAPIDLLAAPTGIEEARDLLEDLFAATYATANYAAGRAALIVYALRRTLEDVGALRLRAAWTVGGFEKRDGMVFHRDGLATAGDGEVLVSGRNVAAGTGGMLESAPPFGIAEEGDRWPWEEAGILVRWAILEPLENGPST